MSMTLSHPDEVSGTTICNDGTKVYWTEGYSNAVIVHPNGTKENVHAWDVHPVLERPEVKEMATESYRCMTEAEAEEWNAEMQMG